MTKFKMIDISYETFGKYQHCTRSKDGKWYADQDMFNGRSIGYPKWGSIPAPEESDRSPYYPLFIKLIRRLFFKR